MVFFLVALIALVYLVLTLCALRSYHRRQMSAQGWCNAITLTAQLSARTRQQRYGAFAPVRMPAAPKEGDRHLLRLLVCRSIMSKIVKAL